MAKKKTSAEDVWKSIILIILYVTAGIILVGALIAYYRGGFTALYIWSVVVVAVLFMGLYLLSRISHVNQ